MSVLSKILVVLSLLFMYIRIVLYNLAEGKSFGYSLFAIWGDIFSVKYFLPLFSREPHEKRNIHCYLKWANIFLFFFYLLFLSLLIIVVMFFFRNNNTRLDR